MAMVCATTVMAQQPTYLLLKKDGKVVDYVKAASVDSITFENRISKVTRIQPIQGKPGTTIMITGAGFNPNINNTTVTVGGVKATIKNLTSTRIQAVVPENLNGSYPVVVNTYDTPVAGPNFEYNMSEEEVMAPHSTYSVISPEVLLTKNCYLFTLLATIPQYKSALEQVDFFNDLSVSRLDKLKTSADATSAMNAMRFSTTLITKWANTFADLWEEGNVWDMLVKQHLWPSGMYDKVKGKNAKATLSAAFSQDALYINRIIGIYGIKNLTPHCSDDVATATDNELAGMINWVRNQAQAGQNMFDLSLMTCRAILQANGRENTPILFEPYATVGNACAMDALRTMNWANYSYGVILCPGAGPDNYATALTSSSKDRCNYAINEYKAKRAPFIMVSGGKVHPAKTNYCEAYEMKKYLMSQGIPESAIIMEPQARHTPTNFRNCARIMFRAGMPVDKPCVAVCEHAPLVKFYDGTLQARFTSELGYQAVTFGKELNNNCVEFSINPMSLTIGVNDTLDP